MQGGPGNLKTARGFAPLVLLPIPGPPGLHLDFSDVCICRFCLLSDCGKMLRIFGKVGLQPIIIEFAKPQKIAHSGNFGF